MLAVVVFVALGVVSESAFKFHAGICLSRISFGGFWGIRQIAVLKTVFVNVFAWFEASKPVLL
jgi:hypothetical protein